MKIIIIFFFLLVVAPIVSAVPPFEGAQSSAGLTNQLTFVYPNFRTYDNNCNITFAFDVFGHNLTKFSSADIDCIYKVFDNCGDLVVSSTLTYNTSRGYWFFTLPDTTAEGVYNYDVYCNHTHVGGAVDGGFIDDVFEIVDGGIQLVEEPNSWIPFIIGLGIFAFAALLISFNIKEKLLEGLKSFLFLLGLIDSFLIFAVIYLSVINPLNVTISTPLILGFLISHGLALIAIIWMYAAFLVERRMILMGRDND